jgi:C-terminal processing protease CtpA/Prc
MKKIQIFFFSLFLAFQSFGQIPNTITQPEKIFGLSKIWQEVNYNFANFDHVPSLNWDSAYMAFIPKVIQAQNDLEYYKMLMRFSALLKDAHTSIYYPKSIDTCMYSSMFGETRFYLRNIDNKAIIVYINKSKKGEIPIGSEIIEVNDQPTGKYLENEIIPLISASTDYVVRDWSVANLFWGFKGQKYMVKIKTPSGEIKTLSLIHEITKEKEIYPSGDRDLFKFKWLDNKIAFVALNDFGDPKIDSLFVDKLPELRKAKGLILDVRKNGGGSSNYGAAIAQYLSPDSVIYASKISARTNNGLYRARGSNYTEKDTINNPWVANAYLCYHNKSMEYLATDTWSNDVTLKDRIIIPTVVLIGHETCSAAEEFLLFLDNPKQIIRIGQNSNGSNGQPYFINLPGGGGMRICTQHCTYPDGRKYVGYGVKPDIEVKETVEDFINSRDAALQEAVKYLDSDEVFK